MLSSYLKATIVTNENNDVNFTCNCVRSTNFQRIC